MDIYNISIHAPTRGATKSVVNVQKRIVNFNPRSYKRSDTMHYVMDLSLKLFQSTLLQEERHIVPSIPKRVTKFQSTLLQEERPPASYAVLNIYNISIHAPTRGATFKQHFMLRSYAYFNPRSYKRSDVVLVLPVQWQLFQSTLLQEERL